MGRRRLGLGLLGGYAALLLATLAFALTTDQEGLTHFADTGAMAMLIVTVCVLALAWFTVIVLSYVALRPSRLNQQGQIVTGIITGVLCVVMMSPFALTANLVYEARGVVTNVFQPTPDPDTAPAGQNTQNPEDPWGGRTRMNFLLVGGDAAGNREGVRTDSMTVASVDIKTGATVLFSLPRNLQHVRFPQTSPLHKQFPNGFMAELPNGGLLNEVWQYANDHPDIMGGQNRGPRALMDAIGYTLGLKIDHYVLINMYGFAALVDAIGGLKIRIERDVKWGGLYGTAGTIKAGYRRLSGEEALWYGRSRVNSDDFSRMARQRCVIGAFAQQATPDKILFNFGKISKAAKHYTQTNLPQTLVQPLAALALKVKNARITSLQFVPPEFYSGRPDWAKIRRASSKAISDSLRPAKRALAANVTASPGVTASPSASATATAPRTTTSARPTQTPTQNDNRSAKSLSELCGF
ncbi:LCP family protein [Nonomuraea antri]|uniref:LCP family protein n=1 Tax=Nonomuraea antri TaxID=2730852 RepID=UPI001F27B77F|nr:LCP family protein [Nonomuraea antri]